MNKLLESCQISLATHDCSNLCVLQFINHIVHEYCSLNLIQFHGYSGVHMLVDKALSEHTCNMGKSVEFLEMILQLFCAAVPYISDAHITLFYINSWSATKQLHTCS